MSDKSDPTKDPKFKQVVDHFLHTPPKPHKRKRDEESDDKPPKREGGRKGSESPNGR